jgi:hypothetical protein
MQRARDFSLIRDGVTARRLRIGMSGIEPWNEFFW